MTEFIPVSIGASETYPSTIDIKTLLDHNGVYFLDCDFLSHGEVTTIICSSCGAVLFLSTDIILGADYPLLTLNHEIITSIVEQLPHKGRYSKGKMSVTCCNCWRYYHDVHLWSYDG